MSALNEPVAKRIADLVRRLASDFEGEQLNTVAALKRTLKREGLSLSDIAVVIESCNGAIEERKYSDTDAEIIYARGVQKGREEEARNRQPDHSPKFYDVNGHPRWNAIALFCQKNFQRLRPTEQGFVDDIAGNTMWRKPTEKQAKWLLSIFIRLGGRRN